MDSFLKFLSGVAVGFVAGILLAPQKGEETRRQVTERAKNWRNELDTASNVEKISNIAKDAFEVISEYADKIRKGQSDVVN